MKLATNLLFRITSCRLPGHSVDCIILFRAEEAFRCFSEQCAASRGALLSDESYDWNNYSQV